MASFTRFFREYLKRYLPLIAGGSLLLSLAGACQGLIIAIIRLARRTTWGWGPPCPGAWPPRGC